MAHIIGHLRGTRLATAAVEHSSNLWLRLVSAGLIPLTLAPFIGGSLNPLTDSILGATVLIHSYIGFQACIVDYFPTYRVPKVQTALMWVLRLATVLTGIGFYEFETSTLCMLFLVFNC